jgi:protein TonB
VRADNLSIPLLSSIAVHGCAILLASFLAQTKTPRPQNYFSVHLLEAPVAENRAPRRSPEPKLKPAPRPVPKTEPAKVIKGSSKARVIEAAPALPATKQQEVIKTPETKTATPAPMESSPSPMLSPNGEGGGSPAGALASSGKGEIGVAPGNGTGVGGGGTAAFGLGRNAGAPGSPGQPVLRTNREAKPIQTARANYPAMALRSGLESDVTLKIEVDPQGNVINAEIAMSGGGGFDEEALKAVKQSRFEPAQRDGENIAAEFTYVYRFRIRR